MPETHIPLVRVNQSRQLSAEIEESLHSHTLTPVTEIIIKNATFNKHEGPVAMGFAASSSQLASAADLFVAHNLDVPSAVMFAKILPEIQEDTSVDSAKVRGLVYAALYYKNKKEMIFYGGLLNRQKSYAPHMYKRVVATDQARPDTFEMPDASVEAYRKDRQRFATGAREFGQWCLSAVGVRPDLPDLEPITKHEFHLLRALVALG